MTTSFHRHRVSRQDASTMGIRMRLHDGEPIGLALRRFKKLISRANLAYDLRQHVAYAEPSLLRRKKKFQKRLKARRATLDAQMAGEQPVQSLAEAKAKFKKRTGKP